MTPRVSTAVTLLAALFAAPALRAADTDCSKNESGLTKAEWLHPLPEAAKLPPVAQIAPVGAFVLLDETVHAGTDTVYTLMVQLGTRAAADRFQSIAVDAGFSEFAEIRARVMTPDGKVAEMNDRDVSCKVVSFVGTGYNIGKSVAPKHYILNVRGLGPGAVLQYQIARKWHRDLEFEAYWRRLYSNIESFRDGGQGALVNSPFENLLDDGHRYPAANVMFTYLIPIGMKFEYKILNDNGRVKVTEQPKPNAASDKVISFIYSRAPLAAEPHEPYLRLQDPELVTWVKSTAGTTQTTYKISPENWNEMVAQDLSDPLLSMQVRGGVSAIQTVAPGPAAGTRAWADGLNRHLRDRVARATGNELRTGFGYRPPGFVINSGRVGTSLEKALALIATAREAGLAANLVVARTRGLPPIHRPYAILDWFGHYLAAVDFPTGRVFYDPNSTVAAGEIRESLQGGEALLVKDRKNWEWITLPVASADKNGVRAEYRVEKLEGDAFSGTANAAWRGAEAEGIRFWLRESDPVAEQRAAARALEAMGFQGFRCEDAAFENLRDPDQPLRATCRFTLSSAVNALGAKKRIHWLPGRPGPDAPEFAAEKRARPLDFMPPARYESVVRFPVALSEGAEPPPAITLSAQGCGYEFAAAKTDEGLELRRTLTISGMISASAYGEVRKFIQATDAADQTSLLVGAAAAGK